MKNNVLFCFVLLVVFFVFPQNVGAKYNGNVSVWIPYWADTAGITSATDSIKKIDTIHPFVFEMDIDDNIVDRANLKEEQWQGLFEAAHKKRVDIIPTIAWFDGYHIDTLLTDESRRSDHVDRIVDLVEDNDFDGIDIDYEQKWANTHDAFGLFLKELKKELGRKKILSCTIEARTPPELLYKEIPDNIEYANDFEAINDYCDVVNIMAYDQQRAVHSLNTQKTDLPYVPVADVDWVEMVIDLAKKDIDEDKLHIGVPTYGRQWRVDVSANGFGNYRRVNSVNKPWVVAAAQNYGIITLGRTDAGEAGFVYIPNDSKWAVFNMFSLQEGVPRAFWAVKNAQIVAQLTGQVIEVRFVTYSDAGAIDQKMDLAKKEKLKGISIFKIDGEEDDDIWSGI